MEDDYDEQNLECEEIQETLESSFSETRNGFNDTKSSSDDTMKAEKSEKSENSENSENFEVPNDVKSYAFDGEEPTISSTEIIKIPKRTKSKNVNNEITQTMSIFRVRYFFIYI